MAYNAVAQREHEVIYDEEEESTSGSPPPQHTSSSPFQPLQMDFDSFGSGSLFMEHEQDSLNTHGLSSTIQSIVSKPTKQSYEMLEGDDYTQISPNPSPILSPGGKIVDKAVPDQRPQQGHDLATATADENENIPPGARPAANKPIVRTASGRRIDLRHPTPDLQSLQGAYMANVENLEKTAEQLSMTSSIDDAIRQMHNELKRSDSRRSSLLASPIDMPAATRQFSSPSSILEINTAARSGGFSPGGFNMISPQHSFSKSGRGRSASKSSKFGSRPEPELEGRPLDSFVNHSTTSPHLSRSASIAEEQDETTTINPPVLPVLKPLDPPIELYSKRVGEPPERPATSGSTTTLEQAQKLFNDFDGEHYNPKSRDVTQSRPKMEERRVSLGNRLSTALPQSYSDPTTGQQMVYYPAPVPMMLNLPQKLSKAPSSMTREKRRSQVMSSIPPAARKSAIWLPDVLEDVESLKLNFAEDDATQQREYMPQHQRRTMGGRRSVKDLEHLPPQLQASTFFELQDISQIVEVKGESAVATLDSILDASAFAPVSAFTDHAFAGRLGAEVYGAANKRASRPISQAPAKNIQKRKSLSNILLRRASTSELLNSHGHEQRRATISDALGQTKFGGSPQLAAGEPDLPGDAEDDPEADESEEDDSDEGHPDDIIYHGAPTTLLAELQIRKQQQKLRTRALTTLYPNGVHSTLLELDAVAQVEKKARKQKRVALAWEDPDEIGLNESDGDDEDVPLAMLFPQKSAAHIDRTRPMGLMERREMEDNEPLSQRRDRLQGKPPRMMARASTMIGVSTAPAEDEGETLAQRVQRLRAQGGTATGLPTARPVSGDFTSELMSQFGGDVMDGAKPDAKGKAKDTSGTPPAEEEETLGQRRKRLQAEREAREKEVGAGADAPAAPEGRPTLKKTLSMADILQAHPAAGASRPSYNLNKTNNGLLGMHERQSAQRSSTTQQLQSQQPVTGGFMNGYNRDSMGGMMLPQYQNHYSGFVYGTAPNGNNFATPYQNQSAMNLGHYSQQQMMMPMPFVNPYAAMGYGGLGIGYQNPMAASMLQMQSLGQELNPRQMDMVERWRQSVMQ
jgi:hypothetical protein